MLNAEMIARWEDISSTLAPAVRRDPKRDIIDLMGAALNGQMAFWRMSQGIMGYVVTQLTRDKAGKRTFWIIYAGVSGGERSERTMGTARDMMTGFELVAKANLCADIRFEGRDWRRVLPDYRATKGADGRWNFRKAIT